LPGPLLGTTIRVVLAGLMADAGATCNDLLVDACLVMLVSAAADISWDFDFGFGFALDMSHFLPRMAG
jgi:hypothetical protein